MKKFSWSVLGQAAYRKVTQLIKQSGYSDRTMASKIGDIVSYNRIRDIRLGLKAPVRMSEYLAICDACGADPVQTLREIITEARRIELEQQTATTSSKVKGDLFSRRRLSVDSGIFVAPASASMLSRREPSSARIFDTASLLRLK